MYITGQLLYVLVAGAFMTGATVMFICLCFAERSAAQRRERSAAALRELHRRMDKQRDASERRTMRRLARFYGRIIAGYQDIVRTQTLEMSVIREHLLALPRGPPVGPPVGPPPACSPALLTSSIDDSMSVDSA